MSGIGKIAGGVAIAAVLALHAPPSGAQQLREPGIIDPEVEIPGADRTAPADCRAIPDEFGGEDGPTAEAPTGSVLDECGSVLAPPVTGDAEMVLDPQQGGETPVIDPAIVPPPMAEED